MDICKLARLWGQAGVTPCQVSDAVCVFLPSQGLAVTEDAWADRGQAAWKAPARPPGHCSLGRLAVESQDTENLWERCSILGAGLWLAGPRRGQGRRLWAQRK